MTTIYISGPMRGYSEHNFPAFEQAEKLLLTHGFKVISPVSNGHVEGWHREDYLRVDIRHVTFVDGVATLPGWENSWGAQLEVYVAQQLNILVLPLIQWIENIDYD